MAVPTLQAFLQVGIDILNTALGSTPSSPSGTILAQTGSVGRAAANSANSGEVDGTNPIVDCDNAEWWQHYGFASRPPNPKAGVSACQGVALRASNRDIVIASRDVRTNSIYGNLAEGETCVFAAGPDGTGQARSIYKSDGSITHYTTTTNDASGRAVYERVHPTKGWSFVAPWGSIFFDQVGLRVKHASGFEIRAGQIGGLPFPGSLLSSMLFMRANFVKLEGTQTYLGAGPLYNPASYGLAENPLTTPPVPILTQVVGVPIGLICSNSVRLGL